MSVVAISSSSVGSKLDIDSDDSLFYQPMSWKGWAYTLDTPRHIAICKRHFECVRNLKLLIHN